MPFVAIQTNRNNKNMGEEINIGLPIKIYRCSPHEREVL